MIVEQLISFTTSIVPRTLATYYDITNGDGDYGDGRYQDREGVQYHRTHLLGLAVVFGVFGGLHCVPWNFSFPSEILRTTWRAMSMILIISPIGAITSGRFDSQLFEYLYLIFSVSYALARMGLIVEAVYLLRDLPDSALHNVDWMDFLPRI